MSIKRLSLLHYSVILLILAGLLLFWPGMLANFFSTQSYQSRADSILWDNRLISLDVIADTLIGLSYIAISLTLAYFIAKSRPAVPFRWLCSVFVALLIAGSVTHFMDVLTLWIPLYWASGYSRLIAALVSVASVIAVPVILPNVLAVITTGQRSDEVNRTENAKPELPSQPAEPVINHTQEQFEQKVQDRTADLTKALDELQISQTRLAKIIELSEDGIISVDKNQRITMVNPAAEKIFGYPAQEIIGNVLDTLFLRKLEPAAVEKLATTSGYLRSIMEQGELCGRRKDGSEFPVETSFTSYEVGGEKMVTVRVRDITERVRNHEALKQSEEHYRFLANVMPQIVWTARPDGWTDYLNRRWVEYTGMPLEKSQGWDWTVVIHPDDREKSLEQWKQALQTGEIYQVEYRFKQGGTGAYRWFLGRAIPMRDQAGKIVKWFGTCTDIDDQKRATQEIAALNAELEQRVQERTRELEAFSYSVSHDLRAPLRAMNGFSNMLVEDFGSQLPNEANHFLRVIQENAQQMSHLIDSLLNLSRLSRQPLNQEPVNLDNLVQDVLETLKFDNPDRNIEITVGPLGSHSGDATLLKQVFTNLLSNAYKFTKQREIARIEVGIQNMNGEQVYFVRDNGTGFDMRYADKLFGVFQRFHRPEEYEGTGVGLAIVQRIIHRHEGRIWADSEVDQGTTFYFTLG